MSIGKDLEWWFRRLRLAPRVLREYGTLTPERIAMPHCIGPIHINPQDRRATKKILFDSIRNRYPINRRFWNDFVGSIRPTLALDIGANYGECAFALTYAAPTEVLAFEASPVLIPFLEKSLAEHPTRERIHLINALVDERPGEQVNFYINSTWSGASTAISDIAQGRPDGAEVQVQTVSVDSVVADGGYSPQTLVFKCDVEGYEPNVFLGMRQTLARAELAVGFIEVDTRFLAKTGWSPERYDAGILNQFDLYVPEQKNQPRFRRIASLAAYLDDAASPTHFDLLLIKKGTRLEQLPAGWELRES